MDEQQVETNSTSATQPLAELRGVGKKFGPAWVLSEIDLGIARGSVHGLVGENGAGKSTLGKILCGVHRPSAGEVLVDRRSVSYATPHDALKDGLALVAQELSLVPHRSVMENVLLGSEAKSFGLLRNAGMRKRYRELEEQTEFGLSADAKVGTLRLADQQKVEIMRAIARDARLIVMDEPTASLTRQESLQLLDIIRKLRDGGTTFVYISHALEEVLEIVDQVSILRDGRMVRSGAAKEETTDTLIRGMIGRSLSSTFPDRADVQVGAARVLEVEDVSGGMIANLNFSIGAGEIVGLAGLVGSGRSEIAHALFGSDRRTGSVRVAGREVPPGSPAAAMRAGIGLVPESRKDQGLVLARSLSENVTLAALSDFSSGGVLNRGAERRAAVEALEQAGVRGGSPRAPVATLSGGNQQKVLFAKWLFREPRILIADEPTRGVDVGAKRAIYDLIVSLAARGSGVLVISSEMEEIFGLAHRILVVRRGEIVAEMGADEATEDKVLPYAFGTATGQAPA